MKNINLKNIPWRPVLGYLVFGVVWIYFSDQVLSVLVQDPEMYQRIQTYKGIIYVLLTGGLLYVLIKYDNRKLLSLAYKDSLTGMDNRVAFEQKAKYLILKKIPFTVYLIDINNFKHLNEVHGHDYGDRFLTLIGNTLEDLEVGSVFRWWGDQFLLISMEEELSQIIKKIDMIQSIMGKDWHMDNVSFHCSVNVGVSSYPKDCKDFTGLSQNLDITIFKAKENGKEQYVIYSDYLLEEITYLSRLEHELKIAMAEEGLNLHFQPIVDLKTEEITSYEVLLRWVHEDTMFSNIGKVIQAAEKTQQISAIDRWVIDHLFKIIHEHPVLQETNFSLNVSSVFFRSSKFVNFLLSKLEEYRINPERITLEVTEYSIIQDFEKSKKNIDAIKLAGIKMSIDDFGTKYSSLGYLSRIPFDVLKIDKSYIDFIHNNPTDLAIAKLLINLGQDLDLVVVAEGIEYKDQKDLLIDLNCEKGQGYYFAKPMPLNEMIEKELAKK